jgi:ATP-binding cassette, subfamily C (CFTR/MRP), member 1
MHCYLADVVSQYATNEQNMNAVERVLVYTDLPHEGSATKPKEVPPSWPDKGGMRYKDVDLAYREGLPLILKKVSFEVEPGEKVRALSELRRNSTESR